MVIAPIDKVFVVAELENRGKASPLPWRFSAKWILNDPKRREVFEFATKRLTLSENFWESYLVKVVAKDGGMYVFSVEAEIQSDNEPVRTVQIGEGPYVATFADDVDGSEEFEMRAGIDSALSCSKFGEGGGPH
jgi:hypothetical protein